MRHGHLRKLRGKARLGERQVAQHVDKEVLFAGIVVVEGLFGGNASLCEKGISARRQGVGPREEVGRSLMARRMPATTSAKASSRSGQRVRGRALVGRTARCPKGVA